MNSFLNWGNSFLKNPTAEEDPRALVDGKAYVVKNSDTGPLDQLRQLGVWLTWQEDDVNPRTCTLEDLFENDGLAKVLSNVEKGSASNTIIVTGTLRPPPALRSDKAYVKWWNVTPHRPSIVKVSFPALGEKSRHKKLLHIEQSMYEKTLPIDQIEEELGKYRSSSNSLATEVSVYRHTNQLLAQNVTPNLVAMYGEWICTASDIVDPAIIAQRANKNVELTEQLVKASKVLYKNAGSKFSASIPVQTLVLEKAQGRSLMERINAQEFREEQLFAVLFQVIYTLHVLTRRGIRHGDLHPGNILVDFRPSQIDTKLAYFPFEYGRDDNTWDGNLPQEFFEVPTGGYIAKLFDWDWGGVYEIAHTADKSGVAWPDQLEVNFTALSGCKYYSACGTNNKADVYTLLSSLHSMASTQRFYPGVIDFIESVVNRDLLTFAPHWKTMGGYPYRLCDGVMVKKQTAVINRDASCEDGVSIDRAIRFQLVKKGTCSGPWIPDDCVVQSPFNMLFNKRMYKRFSRRYPKVQPTTRHIYGDWPNVATRTTILEKYLSSLPSPSVRAKHDALLVAAGLLDSVDENSSAA